jgi:putative redox protein
MGTLHQISTAFVGGMAFDTVIDGHTIRLDTKTTGGGNNSGPSPKPLLLSALAGCTGMDIVSLLNKMKVNFDQFSIQTKAELTDEHPRVYASAEVIYKIKIAETERTKMEKAVNLSKEKYCGVSAMLGKAFPIKFSIEYL